MTLKLCIWAASEPRKCGPEMGMHDSVPDFKVLLQFSLGFQNWTEQDTFLLGFKMVNLLPEWENAWREQNVYCGLQHPNASTKYVWCVLQHFKAWPYIIQSWRVTYRWWQEPFTQGEIIFQKSTLNFIPYTFTPNRVSQPQLLPFYAHDS